MIPFDAGAFVPPTPRPTMADILGNAAREVLEAIGQGAGAVRQAVTGELPAQARQEAERAGLSLPAQAFLGKNVPVLHPTSSSRLLDVAGAYSQSMGLPPPISHALAPITGLTGLPIPGVIMNWSNDPSILAHEALHSWWDRGMTDEDRRAFIEAAMRVNSRLVPRGTLEERGVRGTRTYFRNTPYYMREANVLGPQEGAPPSPSELHSYVGELGAQSLQHIPRELRPFYEWFYAPG